MLFALRPILDVILQLAYSFIQLNKFAFWYSVINNGHGPSADKIRKFLTLESQIQNSKSRHFNLGPNYYTLHKQTNAWSFTTEFY